jgi:hypothetical protein
MLRRRDDCETQGCLRRSGGSSSERQRTQRNSSCVRAPVMVRCFLTQRASYWAKPQAAAPLEPARSFAWRFAWRGPIPQTSRRQGAVYR